MRLREKVEGTTHDQFRKHVGFFLQQFECRLDLKVHPPPVDIQTRALFYAAHAFLRSPSDG
jgi:hypothetical protein